MSKIATLPSGLLANAVNRLASVASVFPGYFPGAKHNHYADFGWATSLGFNDLYQMYERNSIATAAVDKTASKCWRDNPIISEDDDAPDEESAIETEIRKRFGDLRLWQQAADADRRSMVGRYGALVLRFADDKLPKEPVDTVRGGLAGLVEVIPAWQEQLIVSQWDTDLASETYGKPLMFTFNEAAVADSSDNAGKMRAFEVHPDRVIIFSRTGTVHGRSILQAGFNDLMTLEKVSGAGGEGFWKNAKQGLKVNVDKDAPLVQMAQAMGFADVPAMLEGMGEQVEAFNKGFDHVLMTQGMETNPIQVTLPDPEPFFGIALQSFAAGIEMPVKILTGMQTGERASTEDAKEWADTCQARRERVLIPIISELIARLVRVGIIPERDWKTHWNDLTESSMPDKIDRASKMADTNNKMAAGGELIFTPEEIREVVDLKPLSAAESFRDDTDDDEGTDDDDTE